MRNVTLYLVLGFASFLASWPALAQQVVEETAVVDLPKGDGPGQIICKRIPGFSLYPACFCVDSPGVFYVPQTDMQDRIRVNKYDANGRFLEMLSPEGEASDVSAMAVDPAGHLYLALKGPGLGLWITIYEANGKPLQYLGAQGPLSAEQVANHHRYTDLMFPAIDEIAVAESNGDVIVTSGPPGNKTTAAFVLDAQRDFLRSETPSTDVVDTALRKREKALAIRKSLCDGVTATGVKRTLGQRDVLLADGTYYYMSQSPPKSNDPWRIYRVKFADR